MSELLIKFDKESPGILDEKINIKVISEVNQNNIEYKFLEGVPGERNLAWKHIQDFSEKSECDWRPKKPGEYMIMVQAKEKNSINLKNINARYTVKNSIKDIEKKDEKDKLIKGLIKEKELLVLGEKINVEVITKEEETLLYRFLMKGEQGWEVIKNYSPDNKLTFTTNRSGEIEILTECKRASSQENVEDFERVTFKVTEQPKIEVEGFKCLSKDILTNEDLTFKVYVNCDERRTILYKFLKIDQNGRSSILQDYSTKNTITYVEKTKGEYKILCHVKDLFSNKNYDDRAIISYKVEAYNPVIIQSFTSDSNESNVTGTNISFDVKAIGGKTLLYKYLVDGEVSEDTGYSRRQDFVWIPTSKGEYKVILMVKDMSFEGDYEDKKELYFNIEEKGDKPVKIVDVISTKTRGCVKNEPINIKVKAEGGASLMYSFIVYKDGKEVEKIDYGRTNWTNFIPEESGEYELEIRVLDKYSNKEFDAHNFLYLKVKDYQMAEIDYLLLNQREHYLVGEPIEVQSITRNTKNVLLKYVTKINGHEVEDTDFTTQKRFKITPKLPGKYTFVIYAKNILCKDDYDIKKEVSIYVKDALPVTNTKIEFAKSSNTINEEITFEVSSEGGKDVCYEFYIMEKGIWTRVQEYSKKNYYTFLPFSQGQYRILVLSKSNYKKVNYEDYVIEEFNVLP